MQGARALLLTGLLLPLLAAPARAERWEFTPSLSVREIYSDNIGLSETDPQADWVTELTPGFALRGQNDLLKLNLSGSVQGLYYHEAAASDGDHVQSNPQLQLASTTTLLPNFFYLDAGGNAGQRLVSDTSRGSYDSIALSGDQADYYAYTIAPFIKHRSRSGINFEARAEYGVSEFDRVDDGTDDQLADADTENYRLRLDNAAMKTRLHWALSGSRRYLDRKAGNLLDPDYRSAQIDLSYLLSSRWSLLARAGRTENELGGIETERNGDYSAAGFRWSPNRRFRFSALAGSDYADAELNWKPSRRSDFNLGYRDSDIGLIAGPSWRANIRVQGRRLSSTLSYNEEITTEQQIILDGEQTLPLLDPNGVQVIDPVTGQPLFVRVPNYVLSNDEFERHRGAWTLTWKGRRGSINFSANREQRRYLLRTELDNDSHGAALNLTWPLTGGLDLVGQAREQRGEFVSDGAEEVFTLASVGVRFKLSARSNAGLSVQQVEQDSGRGSRNYEEGRVIAELNLRF